MRALHLGLLLPFAFLAVPRKQEIAPGRRDHRPLTSHLAIIAFLACLYVGLFEYDRMSHPLGLC
ncbi:MAG: hypothetical protein ACOX20_04765 [Limnochordia bacterium]